MTTKLKSKPTIRMIEGHRKINVPEDAMNVFRMKMHDWHYAELAEAVGVSAGCILAIRSGRTKWPRAKTFFALLDALDLEMLLRERGSNQPIS